MRKESVLSQGIARSWAMPERRGIVLVVLSALVFAIYPSTVRMAYADGANTYFILLITTIIRTLTLGIECLRLRTPLFGTDVRFTSVLWAGLFQILSMTGVVGGLAYLSGPLVLIILFSHTLMILTYMIVKGETKAQLSVILTAIMALVGLALAVDVTQGFSGARGVGIALALMAAVATAIRLSMFAKETQGRPPAAVGAEVFVIATVGISLGLLFLQPIAPQTMMGWIWTGISGLSLALGTLGTFYAIALLGAFRFSLFLKLEPIFGTIIAAVVAKDYLTVPQYGGIAVVLASLVAYQYITRPQPDGRARQTKN